MKSLFENFSFSFDSSTVNVFYYLKCKLSPVEIQGLTKLAQTHGATVLPYSATTTTHFFTRKDSFPMEGNVLVLTPDWIGDSCALQIALDPFVYLLKERMRLLTAFIQ